MKNRKSSNQTAFNQKLTAYSSLSAAVATTAALGITAEAHAQGIVNLVAGSFSSTPSLIIQRVDAVTRGSYKTQQGTKAFTIQPLNAHLLFSVNETNGLQSGGRAARGYAGVFGKTNRFYFQSGVSDAIKLLAKPNPVNGSISSFRSGGPLFRTHKLTSGFTGNFPVGNKTGGSFNLNTTGYAGFRMKKSAGHYYFGWLRVKVTGDAGDNRAFGISFVDKNGDGIYGAFNSTVNGGIAVGATAIPEPASVAAGLALFALGAVGVREHRRRKNLAA